MIQQEGEKQDIGSKSVNSVGNSVVANSGYCFGNPLYS